MVTVVPKKPVLSSAAHREPDGADREAETDRTVICNMFWSEYANYQEKY